MGLRDDNLGTPSCARLEGVWVPRMSGQAVTEHGTFCSVPSDDLHMCTWTIIQKPPGESRSLGPLGKLLGIYLLQHFSMFPFLLLPHHWQRLSHFPNEKSLTLWLKAGTRREGIDSLWNCLLSIRHGGQDFSLFFTNIIVWVALGKCFPVQNFRVEMFSCDTCSKVEGNREACCGEDFMSLSQLLHFERSLLCSGGSCGVYRKWRASWGLAYRMALEGIIAVLSILASPKFTSGWKPQRSSPQLLWG